MGILKHLFKQFQIDPMSVTILIDVIIKMLISIETDFVTLKVKIHKSREGTSQRAKRSIYLLIQIRPLNLFEVIDSSVFSRVFEKLAGK